MYVEAFDQAIGTLAGASAKDFRELLQRIIDGLKDHHSKATSLVKRIHEMYTIELRTKDKQFKDLTAEYKNYKHLNNLDRYFA